jgi:putative hydrolase of the HAD superfamily
VGLEAVVFDLDDTLFAERQYVLSGFRAVAAWLDVRHGVAEGQAFSELRDLFESGVRLNTFDQWLSARGLTDSIAATSMVEVYRNHVPSISPAPGIGELLERLGGSLRLGLVSDGHARVQRAKLEALGLGRHFGAVVFSDELGREHWKPSPRPFEVVTELLGVAAAEAVYVADNPTKDFIGARSIGMSTVRLRRPEGVYAHIEPPTPAHVPDFELVETAALEALLEDGVDGLRQVGEANYTPRPIASAERPTNVNGKGRSDVDRGGLKWKV